jgi:hypothetical protein
LRRAAGLKTVDDITVHRAKVREEFDAEISQSNHLPRSLLLSNEHCHSRLTSDNEVRTLYSFLKQYTDSFEVIVYLRPQHELATSLYDQALKAGYADIDVLPHLEDTNAKWVEHVYFDYDDLTSRWERIFGHDALRPRIYARNELAGGNILDDFLKAICCNAEELFSPQDENKSISAGLQQALNAVNRYAKANPSSVPPQARARLISILQRLSEGSGRRPRRAEAKQFFEQFTASNERVRQRYFPQRPALFRPNFEAFPEQSPESPSEVDALIQTLLAITTNELR